MTALRGIPETAQVGVIMPDEYPELAALGIAAPIPILSVTWHDERTGCERAHRYLGGELDGQPADYTDCHFYHGRRCNMNGQAANPCLFHEPESGKSWGKVKEWRMLEYPDGRLVLCFARDAAYFATEDGARVVDPGLARGACSDLEVLTHARGD